jgi:hypothetical protein
MESDNPAVSQPERVQLVFSSIDFTDKENTVNTFKPLYRDGELLIPISGASATLPMHLMQSSHQDGLILFPQNSESKPWRWFGFTVVEGIRYLRGEPIELLGFDTIFELPEQEAITQIAELADSLKGYRTDQFLELYGLYRIAEGGFLLLPDQIRQIIRSTLTEQEMFKRQRQWIRPDLSGTDALVYQLTAIAYALLTGRGPIADESVREDGYQPVPIELMRSDLHPEASRFFNEILGKKAVWGKDYDSWCSEFSRILLLEPRQATDRSRELDEFLKRQHRRAQGNKGRRINRTRNWLLIAAALVIIAVAGSFITQALEPLPTDGLSQRELIEYFYESHSRVDLTGISHALSRGTQSPYDTIMNYLHVTGAVRSAYERTSGIIPAAEWIEQGKPELDDSSTVIGITDLDIRRLDEDTFEASYTFWAPLSPEEKTEQGGAPAMGFTVVEELDLMYKRGHYLIDEIRRKTYRRR